MLLNIYIIVIISPCGKSFLIVSWPVTFQLKQMYLSSDLTHLDLGPGRGGEITIRTLEGVWVQVRPLVVLHVGASVERLHADSAGKPLGAQTRRARRRGRGRSFAAQLTENKGHSQRGFWILSVDGSLRAKTNCSYLHLLQDAVRQR